MDTPPEVSQRIEQLRSVLKLGHEWPEQATRFEQLLTEWTPFVECSLRAESALRENERDEAAVRAAFDRSSAWKEARSMAWLFAHRMGDQQVPVLLLTQLLKAWRMSGESFLSAVVQDDVLPLLFDGYSQGCEERLRQQTQRTLGEFAVIRELAPQSLLVIVAGPLEVEAVRAIVDRASREALRRDAKSLIMDIEQLHMPSHAVLAELWSMLPGVRTLGTQVYLSGVRGVVAELLNGANLRSEGEIRCETLAQAIALVHRDSPGDHRPSNQPTSQSSVKHRSPIGWLKFWQRHKHE